MEEYKIETGIPIPGKRLGSLKYPFEKLEVGQSFLGSAKARSAAGSASKRLGMKFATRKEGDKIRIWRVA